MKGKSKRLVRALIVAMLSFAIVSGVVASVVAVMDNMEIDSDGDTVLEYGDIFVDGTACKIFGVDFPQFLLKANKEIDTRKLGKQTISYSFLGKTTERTVIVKDTRAPELTLLGDVVCTTKGDISNFEDPGCLAFDNVNGDITDCVDRKVEEVDKNRYRMTYRVADSSGNKSFITRDVFVERQQFEDTLIVVQETDSEIIEEEAVVTIEDDILEESDADDEELDDSDKEKNFVGTVYLTFDDGPSRLTPDVLDVLKENGVCATFFVIGFGNGNEDWKLDVVKRAVSEGNVIALHGKSHEYEDIYTSVDDTISNFTDESKFLENELGVEVKILRFPGGSSNTVSRKYCDGVMTASTKKLLDMGYNYFDWNADSNDAGGDGDSRYSIYWNVINSVSPGKDNIVLMHDSGSHKATLEALPDIIQTLKEEGYEFKVLTTDGPNCKHTVNN